MIMEKKDSVFVAGILTVLMLVLTSDRFTGEDGANLQQQQNTILSRVRRLEEVYEKLPPAEVAKTLEGVRQQLRDIEIVIIDMRIMLGKLEERLDAERQRRHFEFDGTRHGPPDMEAITGSGHLRGAAAVPHQSSDGGR